MKTDEEFGKEFACHTILIDHEPSLRMFRSVQIDALEHALIKALELNDGHEWPMSRFLKAEIQTLKEGK